ncbi:hypothetical protein CKM354_000176300 [Cercospora kikuchii]|uniref:Uncharacterized protein n=1 Tax=Cercospora kikuchii TaxID=84275 RepID=A0A9P3F901_9PEZI|nr:uncharacterized protein CKM354_000176300 [Cercospora kikuchii]GIZ38343.1 hypothetical protein CKM354_000176300 [Cercospora kikuchii]
MKTFILLGLTAAASAIDIALFTYQNGYNGGYNCPAGNARRAVCSNVNPNSCCGLPTGGYPSIGFYGIPDSWNLEVRGHEGGNCARTRTTDTTFGTNFKCLVNGPYTGAGYSFRSRKRNPAVSEAGVTASEDCQTPDTFITDEGKKFDLREMDGEQVAEFLEGAFAGSISKKFENYEVAE